MLGKFPLACRVATATVDAGATLAALRRIESGRGLGGVRCEKPGSGLFLVLLLFSTLTCVFVILVSCILSMVSESVVFSVILGVVQK